MTLPTVERPAANRPGMADVMSMRVVPETPNAARPNLKNKRDNRHPSREAGGNRSYLIKVRGATIKAARGRNRVILMSNDAKLGLVLGVAIVLVIALVFFRSDTLEAKALGDSARTTTAAQPVTHIPATAP